MMTHSQSIHNILLLLTSGAGAEPWLGFEYVMRCLVVVFRVAARGVVLLQVGEEGDGGLDGHSLALLVGGVVALFPREEGLGRHEVVPVEGLENLDQQPCKKHKRSQAAV